MAECFASFQANPASQHREGRRARQRLEDARETIAGLLGAEVASHAADRLIFTSGGTEANNLALLGLAAAAEKHHALPHEAVISSIEHPSILGPAAHLESRGWRIHRLRAHSNGEVAADELPALLNDRTRFASIMLGNNETGVRQPMDRFAALCQQRGVPLHTDAVQVAGREPLDFRSLDVAAMTVAAHKFNGPLGVGVLLVRAGVEMEPQLFGGFQQAALRPGTESVALAVGMATAFQKFTEEQAERPARIRRLRDRFEAALVAGYPQLVINGRDAERLPGVSNIAFVGLDRQQLFLALDLAGVCCSTGSACASGSSEPSTVLKAMGLPAEVVQSSLRFSLGTTTTEPEIDDAVRRILAACQTMSARSPS